MVFIGQGAPSSRLSTLQFSSGTTLANAASSKPAHTPLQYDLTSVPASLLARKAPTTIAVLLTCLETHEAQQNTQTKARNVSPCHPGLECPAQPPKTNSMPSSPPPPPRTPPRTLKTCVTLLLAPPTRAIPPRTTTHTDPRYARLPAHLLPMAMQKTTTTTQITARQAHARVPQRTMSRGLAVRAERATRAPRA